jgi:hypothetical protein
LDGITVTLSGDSTAVAQTDANGNYFFNNLAPGATYTVIASKPGWRFTPESYTFVNDQTNRVSDFAATADNAGTPVVDAVVRVIDIGGACAECDTGGNPIDNSTYFVVNHYLDFLGRGPDTAGLRFWATQVDSCGTNSQCREVRRINVSAAFYLSIEFQETGYLVYRLERASYGAMSRYRNLMVDARKVAEGVQVGIGDWESRLASNRRAFADEWVQRAEFRARYDALTDEQFITTIATNAGIVLNAGQLSELTAGLHAGTETRASVLLKLADDEGFRQRQTNRAFVLMQYFGYLRRDPDESGYNFWLGKLEGFNGDWRAAEMVKAFISSIEYRKRFEQH